MLRLLVRPRGTSTAAKRMSRAHHVVAAVDGRVAQGSVGAAQIQCRRSLSTTPSASSVDPSEISGPLGYHMPMTDPTHSSKQRVVMKNFLAALQVTSALASAEHRIGEWSPNEVELMVNEPLGTSETPVVSEPTGFHNDVEVQRPADREVRRQFSSEAIDKPEEIMVNRFRELEEEEEEVEEARERLTASESQKSPSPAPTIESQLGRAVKSRRLAQTVALFDESVKNDWKLDSKLLVDLFDFLVPRDVVSAYKVVCRYRELEKCPMSPHMYARVCGVVGRNRQKGVKLHDVRKMVKRLTHDLEELDEETFQRICYPHLVLSLIRQGDGYMGREAKSIYFRIQNGAFPEKEKLWEKCLEWSRYSRPRDLPYPDMLRDLVVSGRRPFPPHAIQVLQNLFPFTDVKTTSVALDAIVKLQSSAQPSDRYQAYHVDTGTLEQITAACVRTASAELVLKVWDLVELLGHRPTEAMYENTIQTFCMSYRQDDNVFAVLADMESNGFEPSRALVRSISRSLRYSSGRTDHAYYMLKAAYNDFVRLSLASLNAVLSACAELGDVDRAFATFDDFEGYGLTPNEDTFSFLLEALAANVNGETEQSGREIKEKVAAANAVLAMMKESGFPLSSHSLHEYVRLLCGAGEVDKASEVVNDALEKSHHVANKTFLVVATGFGSSGNIHMARVFATKTTEPWDFLENRINRWEAEMRNE